MHADKCYILALLRMFTIILGTIYPLCIYVINVIFIIIPNTVVGTRTQAGIPVTEIINVPVTGPGGSAVTGQFSSHVIVGKVLPCLNKSER